MNATTQDLLQNCTSQFGEKTVEAVMNLPEKDLTWVVYNANMVSYAQMVIIQLRGLEFFDKYVKVVSREDSTGARGMMYFDPKFFEHIGNGYD
jgi:phosphoribosyl-ATP pyrophosphohydrolase